MNYYGKYLLWRIIILYMDHLNDRKLININRSNIKPKK